MEIHILLLTIVFKKYGPIPASITISTTQAFIVGLGFEPGGPLDGWRRRNHGAMAASQY